MALTQACNLEYNRLVMGKLIDILPEDLKKNITPTEEYLLNATEAGWGHDLTIGDKLLDDPVNAHNWPSNRNIRAELIKWLCIDKKVQELIHPKGITVIGAKILGKLDLSFSDINRPLRLTRCSISEEIYLIQANVQYLNFNESHMQGFSADSVTVKGSLRINGIRSEGEFRLLGAIIKGQLTCIRAEFNNPKGYAFIAQDMTVERAFFFSPDSIEGVINLENAKVGNFEDDIESQKIKKGTLRLSGFEYGKLEKLGTADKRLEWIRLQYSSDKEKEKKNVFHAQPYDQLAKAYKEIGYESDAKDVLIAKHDDMLKYGRLNCLTEIKHRFLGLTTAHGYKPQRAISLLIGLVMLSSFIFSDADNRKSMRPAKERVYMDEKYEKNGELPYDYPKFNSLVYAIDTALPFVDLHQEDYWLPDTNEAGLTRYSYWLWIHIALGWFFSLLGVSAVTGIIKKE